MRRIRKRILFTWHPTWTPQIENWTAKQINRNMWRFDKADEFSDVMQEARILFLTLERKYPIVREAPHFFALYKTSLSRMFVDKVRVKQKSVIDQEVDAEAIAEELQLQGTPNYGYFNLLVEELPDELKTVLNVLTTGRVRLKLDRPPARKPRQRENLNSRLKKRLALETADPVGDLRSYFSNT